jgi:PAS domain S-box-containing protein
MPVQIPDEQSNVYRVLVENSLGLMCVHDLDGVLLSVNPAVTQSLGYSAEEGIGRSLRDFLAPEVRSLFQGYLERIRRQPTDSGLMRLQAKDGTERIWFYRNVRYEPPGETPRVLGHAIDITERIRAERALKAAQKELQQARDELAARVAERTSDLQRANDLLRNEIRQREQVEEELLRTRKLEALGVLAGGIAHDFNNFLTVIQGNIGLAKMHLRKGAPVEDLLDQTDRACKRAAALASQLLTFAKGGEPVRRTTSVARLLREAAQLARAGAPVSIVDHIAADLWTADLDASQVSSALHNLLLNARQAMPGGGIIEIDATNAFIEAASPSLAAGRYVKIEICDTGVGIPSEILPRIFDPYFTTKKSGSGLGLATAYSVVSKHGGHLGVRSTPGVGTTFSVYLPASEMEEASGQSPRAAVKGRGRVLVMDDDREIRDLLARVLRIQGFEAECVRDGAEAIAAYESALQSERRFDAVLLDLTIPGGMGGLEAAGKLKELDPDVKLIASSGYSDAAVMSEFSRHGFDERLPKPWTPPQVAAVLARVLGSAADDKPAIQSGTDQR